MTEIIMQAYQVLDEIKNDPVYLKIKRLDRAITASFQSDIEAFQHAKNAYETVMNQGGSHHPDYKTVVKTYTDKKSALYQQPMVQTYFQLEKSFEDMLNQFLKSMTDVISDHIKTPNKLGIVQKGGSCHVR